MKALRLTSWTSDVTIHDFVDSAVPWAPPFTLGHEPTVRRGAR